MLTKKCRPCLLSDRDWYKKWQKVKCFCFTLQNEICCWTMRLGSSLLLWTKRWSFLGGGGLWPPALQPQSAFRTNGWGERRGGSDNNKSEQAAAAQHVVVNLKEKKFLLVFQIETQEEDCSKNGKLPQSRLYLLTFAMQN